MDEFFPRRCHHRSLNGRRRLTHPTFTLASQPRSIIERQASDVPPFHGNIEHRIRPDVVAEREHQLERASGLDVQHLEAHHPPELVLRARARALPTSSPYSGVYEFEQLGTQRWHQKGIAGDELREYLPIFGGRGLVRARDRD